MTRATKQSLEIWMLRLASVIALCCVLYILAAPPITVTVMRTGGRWPVLYEPLLQTMRYETTARFLNWYFNDLWRCGFRFLEPITGCAA